MAIKLSKFTLSKLVVVTPYYLLVNQTNVSVSILAGSLHGRFWEESFVITFIGHGCIDDLAC